MIGCPEPCGWTHNHVYIWAALTGLWRLTGGRRGDRQEGLVQGRNKCENMYIRMEISKNKKYWLKRKKPATIVVHTFNPSTENRGRRSFVSSRSARSTARQDKNVSKEKQTSHSNCDNKTRMSQKKSKTVTATAHPN